MSGYQDYQALADILAAIGTPAQGTGADSIASMIAQLNTVITNTQDTVNNLATALTKLDSVITQIQTGTPSIKNPVQATGLNSQVLAASSSVTVGTYTVTGLSFNLWIVPWTSAGSTIPFCTLRIKGFSDAGASTFYNDYDLPMGLNNLDTAYIITGPIPDTQIQLQIENFDSVAMNYDIYMTSTNIRQDHVKVVPYAFGNIPGYQIPPYFNATKEIMGQWYQAAVASNTSFKVILPPYNGTVSLCLRGDLASNTLVATMAALISENSFGGLADGNLFSGQSDSNGNLNAVIPLPRSSCILNVKNAAASAQGVSVGIIGQEF